MSKATLYAASAGGSKPSFDRHSHNLHKHVTRLVAVVMCRGMARTHELDLRRLEPVQQVGAAAQEGDDLGP